MRKIIATVDPVDLIEQSNSARELWDRLFDALVSSKNELYLV
jgi:hypothetical protein